MNIYAPLAEYREAYHRLLNAAASLGMEKQPPLEFAIGALEAYGLLEKAARDARANYEMIKDSLKLDRDALLDRLVARFGHAISLGNETPVVAAMIQICAAQYAPWTAEECAWAITNQYHAGYQYKGGRGQCEARS